MGNFKIQMSVATRYATNKRSSANVSNARCIQPLKMEALMHESEGV
jgi:hypothetical protein